MGGAVDSFKTLARAGLLDWAMILQMMAVPLYQARDGFALSSRISKDEAEAPEQHEEVKRGFRPARKMDDLGCWSGME